MPKFIVTVVKTESYTTEIEVDAKNHTEAETKAIDFVHEKPVDWSYEESEFTGWAEGIE